MSQAPLSSTPARWRSFLLTVGGAAALLIAIDTSLDAQAMTRSRVARDPAQAVGETTRELASSATQARSHDAVGAGSSATIERCTDPSGAE